MNSSEKNTEIKPASENGAANDEKDLETLLSELKALNFSDTSCVSLYLANVKPSNKKKRFDGIKKLVCSENFEKELKGYVKKCIDSNGHIAELKDINSEQNNRFFYVDTLITDLGQLLNQIESGGISEVPDMKELEKFNSYVIQLSWGEDDPHLYAFKYIAGAWKASNKTKLSVFSKNNKVLADVNDDPVFYITSAIDFIEYDGGVYVANTDKFQTAMNHKERLKEKREEALSALDSKGLLGDLGKETLGKMVSKDSHFMKMLASVHSLGFYANEKWIEKLKAAIKNEVWRLKLDGNEKIIVEHDKEYIKELLIILQNKRVKSIVDGGVYDVDGAMDQVSSTNS